MDMVSPILIWFLLGIFFFFIELTVPGFILFFLGIGAWCVAAVRFVFDISLTTQLIVFLLSSLISLVLLRSWLRSVFLGGSSDEEDGAGDIDYAQATGVLTEAIMPPGQGRVKYGGSFWRAVADEPIAENTVVQIVAKNDLIVQVRPIVTEKEP